MYVLSSSDYLWHSLLSDWDIPLDIPLTVPLASLSNGLLRFAAVKALKLDRRWRNPCIEMRHVHRIISQNSSFVDGMHILPGGRWLVTLQHEQTLKTHVTLWSIADLNDYYNAIFRVTVVGRGRFLHAHHHHKLEQITIGIVFVCGITESIRVYNVSLRGDSLTRHSLVFEAIPDELYAIGRIAGMNDCTVCPSVVIIRAWRSDRMCKPCFKGSIVQICHAFGVFRRYFAVTTFRSTAQHTTACISFYELPPVILDRFSHSAPCWPGKPTIKCSLIASTSWSSDVPLGLELSDDVATNMFFHDPILAQRTDVRNSGIEVLGISFNGRVIKRSLTAVGSRSVLSVGEVRVSSSGRRAVWLDLDPDTRKCALMKFALGRRDGSESGSCISTLMPSFSGLPGHSLICVAIGLATGELYIFGSECGYLGSDGQDDGGKKRRWFPYTMVYC